MRRPPRSTAAPADSHQHHLFFGDNLEAVTQGRGVDQARSRDHLHPRPLESLTTLLARGRIVLRLGRTADLEFLTCLPLDDSRATRTTR
jgi:hypothetical protein